MFEKLLLKREALPDLADSQVFFFCASCAAVLMSRSGCLQEAWAATKAA